MKYQLVDKRSGLPRAPKVNGKGKGGEATTSTSSGGGGGGRRGRSSNKATRHGRGQGQRQAQRKDNTTKGTGNQVRTSNTKEKRYEQGSIATAVASADKAASHNNARLVGVEMEMQPIDVELLTPLTSIAPSNSAKLSYGTSQLMMGAKGRVLSAEV